MTERLPSTGAPAAPDAPATPCRSDEVVLIHLVFRRLFGDAPGLVRDVAPGDVDRAAFLARHLLGLTEMLHTHHRAEDAFFWDRMAERAPACGLHVTAMRRQHEALSDELDVVDALVDDWKAEADVIAAEHLAVALDQVDRALAVHLDDEERDAFPVLDEVLSEVEWDEISAEVGRERPALPLFLLVGLIMDSLPESERDAWIARELPWPMRAAYRLVGRRSYERQLQRLRPAASSPKGSRPLA
ncbi:hemerythrin domain-containing protein [Agromyces bauzanensis]|uniref:Hemerythrin-like domain-containing protein n=1 Tax=Agromyces bauzanensis TaxID=1308924 RepID=A0A917PF52_9MICO|nr:hemerythrin domain-containing protein [Agromyces bauzanensis]GGJ74115.1 hypothetical protein GCM10011372_10230 [Agromyces bauzanensis]